ncbi:DUF4184 family protein [Actinomadura sp. KC345]|uniref:DUF4184 family protein n=1 Tax=Actinomadura sp. KC345 TaxID=2530371 RepID=UPI0014049329|nr:DUF4184 family protein [Actinomadura sp. KC345]
MPFTLSHPAAVLPFARRPLVPSALVIGSLTPDVPYYLYISGVRDMTHRPLGVVTVDVAIGLVVFAVWHLLAKRPLAALAPDRLRERLPVSAPVSWRWVVPSLAIGAASHVLWDAFTHAGAAEVLPWLAEFVGGITLYMWLQVGSGAAGLAVIAMWLARWVRTAPPVPVPVEAARGRLQVFAAAGVLSPAGGLLSALLLSADTTLHSLLFAAIVGAITAASLVLAVHCAWWHAAHLTGRHAEPAPAGTDGNGASRPAEGGGVGGGRVR